MRVRGGSGTRSQQSCLAIEASSSEMAACQLALSGPASAVRTEVGAAGMSAGNVAADAANA